MKRLVLDECFDVLRRRMEAGQIQRPPDRPDQIAHRVVLEQARFPSPKTLDGFDFTATPSLNRRQVVELARCEWIDRRGNVIFLGNPGTGKTHLSVGLGMAACRRGTAVRFFTAAGLVNALPRLAARGLSCASRRAWPRCRF